MSELSELHKSIIESLSNGSIKEVSVGLKRSELLRRINGHHREIGGSELNSELQELRRKGWIKIEQRTDEEGNSNQWIVLKKRYKFHYALIISLIISALIAGIFIIFLGTNIRALNLAGLTIGIFGAFALSVGSLDHFLTMGSIWERTWAHYLDHLFKKEYSLALYISDAPCDYPILRLIAVECGPWFLFIGFGLQFYAVYIDP